MMKKILYIIAAGAMLLAGCNKEENTPADGTAVKFSTEIATRASGTAWDNGDAIGVFMLTAGGTMPGNIVGNGMPDAADNVKYTTDGTNFTGTPIYYPQSGAVDFVAYYPYRSSLSSYTYKVDVSNQTTSAAIDLLYSNNATGKSKSTTAVPLIFDHKLSQIVLNIIKGEGMATVDLSSMNVQITGMPTKADFKLADGTFGTASDIVAITPRTATAGTKYDAIVIPQTANSYTGRKMVFTVGTDVYEHPIPDGDDFASGKNHPYTITVYKTGISVTRGTITDWTTTIPEDIVAEQIPIPQTVKIPKGTFIMGSSDGSNIDDTDGSGLNTTAAEPNRNRDETHHKVTLTKDFYMSKCEITSAQYAVFLNAVSVAGANISEAVKHTVGDYGEQDLFIVNQWGWTPQWNTETNQWESARTSPMIYVSWYGAVAYCNWLSETTGGTWRLPTEAEWEYACRAGTTTAHSFGADNINDYAVYMGNSGNGPSAVGSKLPNPWGLYDMHGNAYEWCSDWFGDYDIIKDTDPIGADTGDNRVFRGGSWYSNAQDCRSAFRNSNRPYHKNYNVGFRVVFVP